MHGEINADLAVMPFKNMAMLFGGATVLLILGAFLLVYVVKKLGIKSLGPIKLEQHGNASLYAMTETANGIDDVCRKQMRQITGNMKIHISNIFAEMQVCTIARIAISSTIRHPLYESIANNHFTTELMPDNYSAYRGRIIETMQDEYVALYAASKSGQCKRESLPSWDTIGGRLSECVDVWLAKISRDLLAACEKKLAVYRDYLGRFEAAKDGYRAGIVKGLIDKNERYVTVLKTRMGKGGVI